MMLIHITATFIAVLVALFRNVCSATGTIPPNTTQPYRFPCGMDRCLINVRYCDKGRSTDPGQWTCSPCTEIEQWCEKDIARVPRDCLGYCEAKRCSASMKALESRYREENQNSRRNSDIPLDETKALSGLERFMAENSIVVVCVLILLAVIVVGLFAHTLRQCRRKNMRGSADDDTEVGVRLMGSKPDSHDPHPTVTKKFSTTGTQTDSTGFLGSASTDTNQVEFVQPNTKGAHGIRVLPSATVPVDNNGKDCTEDTTFLNLDRQQNSAFVSNLA
ncbi:uncharacterized protein LOC124285981 isoform X4 [Haliotis rubra]|uniref:uncharacterized protein LOC124285981 isoform X4 n=1 Tax=Haliotis rubra TaxID=36100 RepID=UPI001EE5746B|nr:uncharacterized protein LOC124285981 isoform X4 [Haliotis rubra]